MQRTPRPPRGRDWEIHVLHPRVDLARRGDRHPRLAPPLATRRPLEGIVIAGHFGLAAAVKAKTPAVPLWALMLACQWLDVIFVPLFLAGIERLEPVAGAKPGAYGAR